MKLRKRSPWDCLTSKQFVQLSSLEKGSQVASIVREQGDVDVFATRIFRSPASSDSDEGSEDSSMNDSSDDEDMVSD